MPTSQKQRQHSSVCWQKPAQCCTLIGEVGKHLPAACPPSPPHPTPCALEDRQQARLSPPPCLPRAQEILVEQPCNGFLVSREDSGGGCVSLMTLLGIPDFHLDTVKDSIPFFSSPACLWHLGPQGVLSPSSWRRQQSHLIRCGLSWAEDKIACLRCCSLCPGAQSSCTQIWLSRLPSLLSHTLGAVRLSVCPSSTLIVTHIYGSHHWIPALCQALC